MSTQLPDYYMITGKFKDKSDFRTKLENALQHGNKIVQLRCKNIEDSNEYLELAKIAAMVCEQNDAILLLATSPDIFNQSQAAGLHLTSQTLHQYDCRPVNNDKLLSVSCHTEDDMQQASEMGANILLLSPVKATSSHPGVPGIGWDKFNNMVTRVQQPVYALGGMDIPDLVDAKKAGAQGIAAISSFWK
jgi:8-oxo-dGTP diphosphatase